jgi:hypothetical protein
MGCAAKVIVFADIRASQQRQALRQQLHAHFDRWLDEIAAAFPESEPPLAQVSETIWRLRQTRTAGVAQTLVEHMHAAEQRRESLRCATCERLLSVSFLPILGKGEHFPRVIRILATSCSHYK